MVYRRVVMVRLILMSMLRYFWVSIGFKFQTPQRGWFQTPWRAGFWGGADAPEGLVSRVYGGPILAEVFESFGQGFSNEEATYFGSEICELAVQLLSCLILIRVNV